MDLQALLDDLAREAAPFAAQGKVADYIPALAAVDPARFGLALATTDGQLVGSGDWRVPFSIQSVSKAFSLALVLARDGEALWTRVGREPSGNPFNSLVQLEYEKGIPRNPFINAGALILIDRLLSLTGDSLGTLRDFLRAESGNAGVDLDPEVAASERIRWQTIAIMLGAGYVDAYRALKPANAGPTFPTWDPHIRLDYAFVRRDDASSVTECDVLSEGDAARRASDHFPLRLALSVDFTNPL